MISLEALFKKFDSANQLSDGSWQVTCPAHDDKQASLHISCTEDKILLRCHAGCKLESILPRLNIQLSDLFRESVTSNNRKDYVYFDTDGNPTIKVVKKTPGKHFHIEHFDLTAQEWKSGLGNKKRSLYRLPELQRNREEKIVWVEGEKDADTLKDLGILSTTTPNGASAKLEGIDLFILQGRQVLVVPDNDAPGHSYAQRVQKALTGLAKTVDILELPGLQEKEDITDWFAKGHTTSEFWELKTSKAYGHIIPVADVIADIRQDVQDRKNGIEILDGIPTGLQEVDALLSAGGIPRGKITIFAGATSSGKSALANTVIMSALFRDKKVLCISLEDDPKCVVYRMISSLSKIQNRQLQHAVVISGNEEERFERAIQRIIKTNLFFKEDALSILDLSGEIQAFSADEEIDLVVLDFLQLVPPGQRFGKKQEEVDFVFGECVQLSRKMKKTAFLVLSQLHRVGDKSPMKEDLYHSGALEQWSHTIGLLYRPNIPGFEDCCQFIIDKQKNGPTGFVVLGWDGDTVSYKDQTAARAREYQAEIAKLT